MTDIEITEVGPASIGDLRGEIARIHQAAFGKSDAYLELYRDVELPDSATYSGWRGVVAHLGGRMVGYALGYDVAADQAWYRNVAQAVRATPVATWLRDAWYVSDIAVLPEAQGQGIGGLLHDRLIVTLPDRDLVLVTHHGTHPAQRFYARRGWQMLEPDLAYRPGAPLTALMGRRGRT